MRIFFIFLATIAYGAAMAQWNWVPLSPSHPEINLSSVVWADGEWVALGPEGKLLTSWNSADWTYQSSGMSYSPDQLVAADHWIAALGDAGAVYTSTDHRSWTYRNIGVTSAFTAGAWNGSRMMLIGANGNLASSSDGITWAKTKLATEKNLTCVAWAGDRWVVTASGGLGYVSTDGTSWTAAFSDQYDSPSFLIWNGRYLVMAEFGVLVSSVDGQTWNRDNSYDFSSLISRPVWAGTHFITMQSNGYGAQNFARSSDGVVWETFPGPGLRFSNFAWAGGVLVTVGASGQIYTSLDEKTWTERERFPTKIPLSSLAASDRVMVAVGDKGGLITSPDGRSWTERNSQTNNGFVKVIWTGDKFYAVDGYGVIVTSVDGTEWKDESPSNRVPIADLIWTGERFLAPTATGMRTSFDGKNWVDQDTGFSNYKLTAVAWNGQRYFAGGDQYFTSLDAVHWERILGRDDPYPRMRSMACNADLCIAVGRGEAGSFAIRKEGDRFAVHSSGARSCSSVLWTGKRFLAVCDGVLRSTTDGVDWDAYPIINMSAVARYHDSLFVVGLHGYMYATADSEQQVAVSPRIHSPLPSIRILPGSVRLELGSVPSGPVRANLYTLAGTPVRNAVAVFVGSTVEFATAGLSAGVYRVEAVAGGKRIGRIFCHTR
ncbi:MAG: hypothetical protein ABI036_17580 [Fibrobacteria bacterium]